MKAIVIRIPGGPEVLELKEVPEPVLKEGEVLVKVTATALNRADTIQRRGSHPPPAGVPQYPGLECSGIIEEVGPGVPDDWEAGMEVCALLGGGGYADKVAVPYGQLFPIPKGVSVQDAASLPEVTCTVWSTVFMTSNLQAGETFLVHGGASGIGTFAIQMAKYVGATVFATAGTDLKLRKCKELGADFVINYKTEDFVERVKAETKGKGVDVILDNMGAIYFQRNLDALATGGRLFIIGFQGGSVGEFSLAPLLFKRLTVQGAGLRARTAENKAQIVAEVKKHVWPAIAEGKVVPVIDTSFPLGKAAEAHRIMEASTHIGKILLLPCHC
eukprot:TRINITY_DN10845_c0_g1_i2.p1 TRINITY_DN10845_c0_g1~~TRINITY_DN10845_c0_g1_i2.p1  ORF type:complete len:330 (-),score=49.04 TRINITY_DN10845_c0_g1_i2:1044-2033(-)